MGSRLLSFLEAQAERCTEPKVLRFLGPNGESIHQETVSFDVLLLLCNDLEELQMVGGTYVVQAPEGVTTEECRSFIRALLRGEEPAGPLATALAETLNGGEANIRRRLQTRPYHDVVVTANEEEEGFAMRASLLIAHSVYFTRIAFPHRCIIRMLGFSSAAVKSVVGFIYTSDVDRSLATEFRSACRLLGICTEGVCFVDREVVVRPARASELTGAKVHRVDRADLDRKAAPAEGFNYL